ncbi:MAG: multidrug ABC transporter substrate-binding protein [Acidobacteria bacterium]|nr:MAG: multidrug ABC transporter substrate-binding protein [Acidobacteriota bacterium]
MRLRLPGFITKDILAMAFDSIRAHKFRSTLTVLGIIIGVMTVIVVAALLMGLRGSLVKIVEEYGANNIYAFHLTTGITVGERDQSERARKPLTPEDGEAIKERASAVEDVVFDVPNIGGWGSGFDDTINNNGKTYRRGNTEAVSANYAEVVNVHLKEGRFINEQDDVYRRNVVVLGVNAAEALFPDQPNNIVGTHVKMGGYVWEVIGVLDKRKSTFLGENDEDNAVFVPYRTGLQVAPGRKFLLLIVQAKSGLRQEAYDQTEEILRQRRNVKFTDPDNFDLKTADSFIGQFDSIFGMVGLIAIAFSGIGLLVGGIGVMNIMLVSVTERTQEIGVRKAIGARRRDIVSQFLYEAMTLTLFGGVIGVVLSFGASQLVMLIWPALPATVPMWAVVTGLLVSIGIGLIFGVWPAMKAARLDPIECLRYE